MYYLKIQTVNLKNVNKKIKKQTNMTHKNLTIHILLKRKNPIFTNIEILNILEVNQNDNICQILEKNLIIKNSYNNGIIN